MLGADYEQDQLTNETARTAWIATQVRVVSRIAEGRMTYPTHLIASHHGI